MTTEVSDPTASVQGEAEPAHGERQAVSLADLYRRGKAKGLLTKRRAYP